MSLQTLQHFLPMRTPFHRPSGWSAIVAPSWMAQVVMATDAQLDRASKSTQTCFDKTNRCREIVNSVHYLWQFETDGVGSNGNSSEIRHAVTMRSGSTLFAGQMQNRFSQLIGSVELRPRTRNLLLQQKFQAAGIVVRNREVKTFCKET